MAKRRFKTQHWSRVCRAMHKARSSLADPNLDEEEMEDRLDSAVQAGWRFGEYAINTCLELAGLKPVADHSQPKRARDLQTEGHLKGSYHDTLEKMWRFRQMADFLSYNRTERSTHYNRSILLRCLGELEGLYDEVDAWLKAEGWIDAS